MTGKVETMNCYICGKPITKWNAVKEILPKDPFCPEIVSTEMICQQCAKGNGQCEYCNGDEMTQLPLPDPKGIRLEETGVFSILPNPNGGYMLADIIMPTACAQYAEIKYCPMCGRKLEG